MQFDWSSLVLLANGEQPQVPEGQGAAGIMDFLPLILAFIVAAYLILWRPERKRIQQREKEIASLKKNDRVVTIGGIYGLVQSVKPSEDQIVLKIDEDNNVKITVTKSSIAKILSKASE